MNNSDHFSGGSEDARPLSDDHWKERLSGRFVHIRTFGCCYNAGDSDILSTVLEDLGSRIVTDPESADAIVLNTCIVIGTTERKMIREMGSYPGKDVYVTGCLPLARPEILAQFPKVRVIMPDSIHHAAVYIPYIRKGSVQVVQVGPGCMGSCRYCITRRARGKIQSVPPEEIISQVVACAEGGAVEIRLAGQDLSAYGCDTHEMSLASLLEQFPSSLGRCKVRLGMMNPATLLPIAGNVARAMKHGPFFSFLHLPIQSGSDQVLDLMERGYHRKDILHILETFRSEIPDITIATDIITGFPGETEEDHVKTLDLLRLMKPGMVNVTRYSWRPGIGMSRIGELPDRIRKDRSRAVIQEAYAALLIDNTKKIGRVLLVVVTEQLKPGSVMARSSLYEGVVIREEVVLGTVCQVTITGCTPHYLIGKLVRD